MSVDMYGLMTTELLNVLSLFNVGIDNKSHCKVIVIELSVTTTIGANNLILLTMLYVLLLSVKGFCTVFVSAWRIADNSSNEVHVVVHLATILGCCVVVLLVKLLKFILTMSVELKSPYKSNLICG